MQLTFNLKRINNISQLALSHCDLYWLSLYDRTTNNIKHEYRKEQFYLIVKYIKVTHVCR